MKVSVAVILFLVLPNVHVAQDSTYIKDFSKKLNIRVGVDSDNYSFKIRNKINKEYYQLNPNETERLTLGIVYRFLVLNAEYAPHLHDNELRGESEIQSIQLRVFIKRFVQQFAYNNIKGFYLQNTSDYVPNWNKNQPYITYDDLGVKRISGRTTFVSNRNFSYKAIAFQSQKQLKSTGSFMPSISYDYTKLNNFKNEL